MEMTVTPLSGLPPLLPDSEWIFRKTQSDNLWLPSYFTRIASLIASRCDPITWASRCWQNTNKFVLFQGLCKIGCLKNTNIMLICTQHNRALARCFILCSRPQWATTNCNNISNNRKYLLALCDDNNPIKFVCVGVCEWLCQASDLMVFHFDPNLS